MMVDVFQGPILCFSQNKDLDYFIGKYLLNALDEQEKLKLT
ncbi:hypothetical protein [Mucilaginibacter jinjuensis]|uniref:Uncharacterized protein n=1 Tax=Mucilaginibacter jinjuensis TaxID=1176721 RepID=A0ABY7TDR4_9SPHI|nr:hypothetical protein [Mucilaginibacter jinjuensis]WCT14166.1 hypothetical protein PQO05_09490 [Mucilaginibacter jinjuensis]